jgi:hypothetical protein
MSLLTLPELLTPVGAVDGSPVIIGPAYENLNCSAQQRDAFVSVSFTRFGDEWVVSAFKIGADGEPGTDNGEIFVKTFTCETRARWLYRSCLAQLKPELSV